MLDFTLVSTCTTRPDHNQTTTNSGDIGHTLVSQIVSKNNEIEFQSELDFRGSIEDIVESNSLKCAHLKILTDGGQTISLLHWGPKEYHLSSSINMLQPFDHGFLALSNSVDKGSRFIYFSDSRYFESTLHQKVSPDMVRVTGDKVFYIGNRPDGLSLWKFGRSTDAKQCGPWDEVRDFQINRGSYMLIGRRNGKDRIVTKDDSLKKHDYICNYLVWSDMIFYTARDGGLGLIFKENEVLATGDDVAGLRKTESNVYTWLKKNDHWNLVYDITTGMPKEGPSVVKPESDVRFHKGVPYYLAELKGFIKNKSRVIYGNQVTGHHHLRGFVFDHPISQ